MSETLRPATPHRHCTVCAARHPLYRCECSKAVFLVAPVDYTWYCIQQCQQADWNSHRALCHTRRSPIFAEQ